MTSLATLLLPLATTPSPGPSEPPVDPNRVTPGLYGFLSLAFLVIVVVVLYFSMRKQLGKINFDEASPIPAGVRPLPKYATKAERRKAAARAASEQAAAADAATPPLMSPPPTSSDPKPPPADS